MKGRDTKEGKHHSARATQTQGKNIETKRERAGGKQRGKVENRKKSPSSSNSSKEVPFSLCWLFVLHHSPPPFLSLHFIHPSIYSLQHTSTHPSFLPSSNIVMDDLHLLRLSTLIQTSFFTSFPLLPLLSCRQETRGQKDSYQPFFLQCHSSVWEDVSQL